MVFNECSICIRLHWSANGLVSCSQLRSYNKHFRWISYELHNQASYDQEHCSWRYYAGLKLQQIITKSRETILLTLQNAKNGTYKLIGDTFRKYPNETLVANTRVGVTRVVEGSYGFLEVQCTFLVSRFELYAYYLSRYIF